MEKKQKQKTDAKKEPKQSIQTLEKINDFRILPIKVPAADGKEEATHYLYLKQHRPPKKLNKEDGVPEEERTLFVLNLPVDATEADVRYWLREAGTIQSVRFQSLEHWQAMYTTSKEDTNTDNTTAPLAKQYKLKGRAAAAAAAAANEGATPASELMLASIRPFLQPGSYAHVVFLEKESIDNALNLPLRVRRWRDKATVKKSKETLVLGMKRYQMEYRRSRPIPKELEKRVNDYILAYEERKRQEEERKAAAANMPDEDGFITVTYDRRKRGTSDGKVTVKAVRAEVAQQRKPKEKVILDFYRFQHREAKREKLLEMRRKFEEDKARIAAMRANRRFKPY